MIPADDVAAVRLASRHTKAELTVKAIVFDTQLFHYLISEFHRTINAYTTRYGYCHRQRLLGALLRVLKGYMPSVEPELVRGYPGSLEQIELLVAQAIIEAAGRVA